MSMLGSITSFSTAAFDSIEGVETRRFSFACLQLLVHSWWTLSLPVRFSSNTLLHEPILTVQYLPERFPGMGFLQDAKKYRQLSMVESILRSPIRRGEMVGGYSCAKFSISHVARGGGDGDSVRFVHTLGRRVESRGRRQIQTLDPRLHMKII